MKPLLLNTRSTLVRVGRSCVRNLVRQSHCKACVSACAYGAAKLVDGAVHIDTEACLSCGACLFTCPTGAIEIPKPPQRHYRENSLVLPLSPVPPGVDELLMWHCEYQIRVVEVDTAHNPDWLIAVASLNLRLKQLKQPLWVIITPPVAEIDKGRRQWLQLKNGNQNTACATPGKKARRALLSDISEYQVILDRSLCFLCGACVRVCPQAAIQLDGETMTLNHLQCTSCKSCEDVCLSQAITVTEDNESTVTPLEISEIHCTTCQRRFPAWSKQETECPICQRHRFGMRNT